MLDEIVEPIRLVEIFFIRPRYRDPGDHKRVTAFFTDKCRIVPFIVQWIPFVHPLQKICSFQETFDVAVRRPLIQLTHILPYQVGH